MGYMHIPNLYKDQTVLMFKEVYALEKVHGTSAHVSWKNGNVFFHSGGEKHKNFIALFDVSALKAKFEQMGHDEVTIFGEAYGGGLLRQSWRYGKQLKFVAFDVKVNDFWLSVPNAEGLVTSMGLEFVHYVKVPTEIAALDAERDAPSVQAKRNGVEGDQPHEGVVIKPLVEVRLNDGERIMAKHKRAEERETMTDRVVGDPAKLQVLQQAEAIATEWVTPTRLEHVLDKLIAEEVRATQDNAYPDMSWTPKVIAAMIEDVTREGAGEIVDSKEARKAIGAASAKLFRKSFQDKLQST